MADKPKYAPFKVGDYVNVQHVRSNHLDREKGIGWYASEVIVQVSKVMDLSFCFEFNGETHFELQREVKKTHLRPNLFGDTDKIKYAKDDFRFRHKLYEINP